MESVLYELWFCGACVLLINFYYFYSCLVNFSFRQKFVISEFSEKWSKFSIVMIRKKIFYRFSKIFNDLKHKFFKFNFLLHIVKCVNSKIDHNTPSIHLINDVKNLFNWIIQEQELLPSPVSVSEISNSHIRKNLETIDTPFYSF